MEKIKSLMGNRFVQYIVIIVITVIVTTIIMPTKINEVKDTTKIEAQEKEISNLQIANRTLTSENSKLQQQIKLKTNWSKVTKPDGTIIEGGNSESETNTTSETNKIIEQLQNLQSENQTLKNTITEIEHKSKETINPKYLTIDLGAGTNPIDIKDIQGYIHGTYGLNNWLVVGGHIQSNLKTKHYIGAGLGGRL